MQSVTLHSDLMQAFGFGVDLIVSATGGLLQTSDLRLGGGTALAALWHHRHSTDLDFVADKGVFEQAYGRATRVNVRDVLRRERDANGKPISTIATTQNMIGFKYDGVPVSFVKSSLENTEDLFSNYVVGDSGVRLAKPEIILRGKLVGRLLNSKNPTDRDGYDIAMAIERYPKVFREALAGLTEDVLGDLLNEIRNASGAIGRGRPIVDPTYSHLADDPWGRALELLVREIGDGDPGTLIR